MKIIRSLPQLIIILLGLNIVYSQDTIIEFNIKNQTITEILPTSTDTSIHFENTDYFIGSLGNQISLNQTPPTTNLFVGTNFSDIVRAELFQNVSFYPFRTAIKLFGWKNDTLRHNCSGIIVSENFVLTSAHCLYSIFSQSWQFDSLLALPAYDNGVPNEQLPGSSVEKIYIFKSYLNNSYSDDVALLKLNEPIGQQVGWIGIAFSDDKSYFSNKVFHKLSYPLAPNPINPSIVYNGDTLYYNYGEIDVIGPFLGLNSSSAIGIQGQSGSSLFYTNNSEYYSFGVFSFSAQYRHYQITNKIFYQLKNIIMNNPAGISGLVGSYSIKVYPNPAEKYFFVEFDNPNSYSLTLQLKDITGRIVMMIRDFSTNRVKIDIGNLNAGLYFVCVIINDNYVSNTKLIIK